MRPLVRKAWALPLLALMASILCCAQSAKAPADRDPVRSPDDGASAVRSVEQRAVGGFVLRANVEEVVLHATVLNGAQPVNDLTKDDFEIYEDGLRQSILSFQHTDLPVSIGLVIDNSGSMTRKRPAVNQAALDLIAASNPLDEAFVVNFADEAFLDQDFTADVGKLREGLSHMEARGGTALYDAVAASADKLAASAQRGKQVILIITDGEDNSSTLTLEQTIRRVQDLSGPVIYSIGLLFGDEMSKAEARHARSALERLSAETGGIAFFPKSIEQVDAIAAEVAREIRNQYAIGYRSSRPSSDPGYRRVQIVVRSKGRGKLQVRTRTGYYPITRAARRSPAR